MKIRSTVPSNMSGITLIEYLTKRFTYNSSDQWLARIEEGRFSIHESAIMADMVLSGGDVVVYDMPPLIEPSADLDYTIVFENEQFLAVNKPGNLLVHKSGRSITHNLIYQLRSNHTPPYKEAHIVNRLDRETSGLVLVAKNSKALKVLNYLFQERLVQKEYHAICEGIPSEASGIVALDICKGDSEIRSKHRVGPRGEGKESLTSFELVRSGKSHSLLKLRPKTGRIHQLRLHAASLGCPIIGDKLYNLPEEVYLQWQKEREEFPPFEVARQMLHCNRLEFTLWGEEYSIEAPFPDDFLQQLSLKVDC